MFFESVVYSVIVIVIIFLALAACYYAGWRDGETSEKKRIKKEVGQV